MVSLCGAWHFPPRLLLPGWCPWVCAGSGLCQAGLPAAGPCWCGLGPVSNGPLSVAVVPGGLREEIGSFGSWA